jgi:uncharacterized protein (TIGR00369 family)
MTDRSTTTPDPLHLAGLERAYHAAPVTQWMGTTITIGDGTAEVRLPVRRELMHGAMAVHGSLYFRLLDDAAFFAANSRVPEHFVLTLTFDVAFYLPVTDGEMVAMGRVVHTSGRIIHAESQLTDGTGVAYASGRGTFVRSALELRGIPGYAT